MKRLLLLVLLALPCFADYAQQATVSIAAASGSTQTNIHQTFTGVGTKLCLAANGGGGLIQNTSTRVGVTVPDDFVLTSDAARTSFYSWGIETYDAVSATNCRIRGWVLIPSLTTGAAVNIYVSIGNAAVNTYQGGAVGSEFDAPVKLAHHLPDGTTLSFKDFTSNANDGSGGGTSPTVAAGQIDGGLTDGGAGYVTLTGAPLATIGHTSTFSVCAWFKIASLPSARINLTPLPFLVTNSFAGDIYISATNKLTIEASKANVANITFSEAGNIATGSFVHTCGTWDGTTATLYKNGTSSGSANYSASTAANVTTSNWVYGALNFSAAYSSFWNGQIDEMEWWNGVALTADTVATLYGNQNSIPVIGAFSPISTTNNKLLLLGTP